LARRRETVFRILEALEVVEPTRPVLRRAAQPLPVALGTLDAIHVATALAWREATDTELVFATHDLRLATAARALGLRTVGA
jgi:predicted nucleic acid-binding protein